MRRKLVSCWIKWRATNKQTNKHANKHTCKRATNKQTYKQTHIQTDAQTYRHFRHQPRHTLYPSCSSSNSSNTVSCVLCTVSCVLCQPPTLAASGHLHTSHSNRSNNFNRSVVLRVQISHCNILKDSNRDTAD